MTKKGFTLVELMVTVVIMMIMTTVVFFNYGQFNDSSLMNQVAYDMSLTIRQAQVYGVATREKGGDGQSGEITTNNAGGDNFKSAYGMHFEEDANNFIMFVDTNEDGVYTDEEELQTYTFQRGIKIRRLCFTPEVGDADTCDNGANGVPDSEGKFTQTLDITFIRPDPEAKIMPNNPSQLVDAAVIYLWNAGEDITKSVVVYSTGQISVK